MDRFFLDELTAEGFARLAIDCVGREYPNHPLTVAFDDSDIRLPRERTPVFFGCFDWHSAVHAHWTLARIARHFPDEQISRDCTSVLWHRLTAERLATEVRHMSKPGREGFERPYGIAWLLQLSGELREWGEPAAEFVSAIVPLEHLCRDRLASWLPKLSHPIRSGEHSQTAFAMGLALDWARTTDDRDFASLVSERAQDFYFDDVNLPLGYEPSGHDFLSPALSEADLMRRVLHRAEYRAWIDRALPEGFPLAPVNSPDHADGKLAHLDGLNLSRAWMLDGIAAGLGENDHRSAAFRDLAAEHARAGLANVSDEHYAGSHWLGTFATYLLTRRGIANMPA